MGFTLLSLFFFHAAIFCRNDYVDNLTGIDRMNEKGGSRVIQNGWLRANAVYRLYWTLLTVAVFFAAPVLVANPKVMWLALIGGGIGILGYSVLRQGRLNSFMPRSFEWLPGDLAVFLSMGPLLAVGANIVAHTPLSLTHCVLLGTGFGLATLAYLEIRHLISIVVDDTSELHTLAVTLGFDNAKRVVAGAFVLIGICSLTLLWSKTLVWGEVCASAFALFTVVMAARILRAKSPLASVIPGILKQSKVVHALYGILFIAVTLMAIILK